MLEISFTLDLNTYSDLKVENKDILNDFALLHSKVLQQISLQILELNK